MLQQQHVIINQKNVKDIILFPVEHVCHIGNFRLCHIQNIQAHTDNLSSKTSPKFISKHVFLFIIISQVPFAVPAQSFPGSGAGQEQHH